MHNKISGGIAYWQTDRSYKDVGYYKLSIREEKRDKGDQLAANFLQRLSKICSIIAPDEASFFLAKKYQYLFYSTKNVLRVLI